MENGGPAPEGITDKIYTNTTTIKEYLIAEDLPDVWTVFQIHTQMCPNAYMRCHHPEFFLMIVWMKLQVDISTIGVSSFAGPEGQFDVDVFDSASDYVKLMKYVSSWDSLITFHFL